METKTTYLGWSNFETWCVALWINNECSSYRYWRDNAKVHFRIAKETLEPHFTPIEQARIQLARQLELEHDPINILPTPSVFSDLLTAALSEVNWCEIAEEFLTEVVTHEAND